ncbi:DNA-protecting protein DprA [Taibaiella lutea]|uniref:DNA-protecting protein DprA n=1 Tax=Taibaiella lutea TaxID=2608001 RepID=A0A5M6CNK5_9BACT|nr:DNA-processing protein DprA [Taibaiella lutea]KAA5536586.1 DNA-protecting protein DprA [Taibaiella lutea]
MNIEAEDELLYRIALTHTDQIGYKFGRRLLHLFGSAKAIFNASPKQLKTIEGIGETKAKLFSAAPDLKKAAVEVEFILKHNIQPLFILDDNYPEKLKECDDAPLMLYYKGTQPLKHKKMVAIIGSRENTDYGARMTEELIEGLKLEDIIIISGLALGIDGIAHRKALQTGLPTIAVVAHGLDTIYPPQHKHIAREMVKHGGLLTEYPSKTIPDKYNFPMRNRIVAGLSDVTIVVETAKKGGAMITAKLAASYNREVAAFPGRTIDKKSEGCNYLIRTNIAQLITGADDLLEMMNWKNDNHGKAVQAKLFNHLTDEEMKIADVLGNAEGMHIDELLLKSSFNPAQLSAMLLTMELNGAVKALPGKRFRMT